MNAEQLTCLIELLSDDGSEGGICDSSSSSSCSSLQTVTPELCSGVNLPDMFWENANTQDYRSEGVVMMTLEFVPKLRQKR